MIKENLFPTKGNVVVFVEQPKKETQSGIALLERSQKLETMVKGVVIVSNSHYVLDEETVMFQINKGTKTTYNKETYFIVNEQDIAAIVE